MLFLQIGAHSPLQSKEPKTQSKQTSARARTHTHTHARARKHTHTNAQSVGQHEEVRFQTRFERCECV